jgi:hypothetical protein
VTGSTGGATPEQLVYVIQAAESGRIKIGVARDPYRRLAELQVGSPEQLELIGVAPGGRKRELELHAELRHDRLHGEWFELSNHAVYVVGNLLGCFQPSPKQIEAQRKADHWRAVWKAERDHAA